MTRRLSFFGALAVGVLIVGLFVVDHYRLAGGGSGTSVQVYYADNISTAHRRAIDIFNSEHRGRIEIVAVDLPFDKFSTNERKELLARSLRNKSDRIDVFAVDQIWVSRFSKWSEPLEAYFTPADRSRFLPNALQSCYLDSTLMAIPMYIDIGMLYYRRDLLQKLPDFAAVERRLRESMSWDEFLGLQKRLGVSGDRFYLFQANDFEGLVCNYFEFLAGIDPSAFAGNSVNLSGPSARAALQHMVDLVWKRKASPPLVVEFDEPQSYLYMLDHDAVFLRGWPNFIENYSITYRDPDKLKAIGRAPLPHFPGKKPVGVYGGWNLMISKFSARKDEALEFVRYMQREDTQKLMFEIGGYIATNVDVYADSAYMARNPELSNYRHLIDLGFHRPSMVEYTKMSDIISHYVRRAIKGEITPEAALARATDAIAASGVKLR
jgi:multiple sugar transport system substrate-binding protein